MIVVLDTNALIRIFGQNSSFAPIRDALRDGFASDVLKGAGHAGGNGVPGRTEVGRGFSC